MNAKDALIGQLNERGCRARIVSMQRAPHLQMVIHDLNRKGLLNKWLYDSYFSSFAAGAPAELPNARSIIIVARHDLPVRITFRREGKSIYATVPPTYYQSRERSDQMQSVLASLLARHGYRVSRIAVPRKLLAVCSGLAEYGRNNISYVEDWGSFCRLDAYCSDLPCESDEWREPVMMEQCRECDKCQRGCPAGAILADRFQVNVERCITFWNEKPAEEPFPEWLKPAWHNCLVGCMICQRVCPVDRDLVDLREIGEEFTEDETAMILQGVPLAKMSQGLQQKLGKADLADLAEVLPRNLKAIMPA